MNDTEKALAYYKAASCQHGDNWHKPPFVPSRVLLTTRVTGDFPFNAIQAGPGEYDCKSNKWGAVSIKSDDGKMLGLRLDEFEPIEWRANEAEPQEANK